MSTLGNVSKPANTVLACETPIQVRISGQKEGTRSKYVKTRCRKCWKCIKTEQLKLLGRYLAECTTAQRVEFWTLTYHGRTEESLLGSKQRCVKHLQDWQKRIRQRERRGLNTYNRREKKAAKVDGREPQLVETKRSYCTFHPVFEFGTKKGRGHFHCVIFWHSHFPTTEGITVDQSPEIVPRSARRVWDLPNIKGPRYPTLPPNANDPECIDWRCDKDGSQLHSTWEHGNLNIKCSSHDMQAVDAWGASAPRRLPNSEIQGALNYTLKYLAKPDTNRDGKPLDEGQLAAQDEQIKLAKGGSRLYRTGSRSMGTRFAKEYGERLANYGVPMEHVHFRVEGVNMGRSRASLAKFEANLKAHTTDARYVQSQLLNAQRVVFQMQGAMRDVAVDAYLEIMLAKSKKEAALGDVAIARLRQLAAKEFNAELRSQEKQFHRTCARRMSKVEQMLMADKLDALTPCASEMLDQWAGPRHQRDHMTLPQRILPPEPFEGYVMSEKEVPSFKLLKAKGIERRTELEKLAATREAIAFVKEAYKLSPIDREKYQEQKRFASCVESLARAYINRAERWKRPNQDEVTQSIFRDTKEEMLEGYRDGTNTYEAFELAAKYVEGVEAVPEFKLGATVEDGIPAARRLAWLNYSDAYDFPEQRERHIKAHCAVRDLGKGRRLVITPDGRVLLGATGRVDKACASSEKVRRFSKYAYRELRNILEVQAAHVLDVEGYSAPIFDPQQDRPFLNNWAMQTTFVHRLVLGLPNAETEKSYITRNRVDSDGPQYRQPLSELPAIQARLEKSGKSKGRTSGGTPR